MVTVTTRVLPAGIRRGDPAPVPPSLMSALSAVGAPATTREAECRAGPHRTGSRGETLTIAAPLKAEQTTVGGIT